MIPKVSVIIPLYNQAQYVGEAIQSALNQTYKNFAIIVVDDGSTDNSREVVGQFGDKIYYIRQENRGLGGARNAGIKFAQCDFVGLLDADDLWLPDFLTKMVQLTNRFPKAAVYYSSAQAMDANGCDLPEIYGRLSIPSDFIYKQLLRANFLIPSTVLIRRSVLNEVGLFEESTRSIHGCEDWDLWLRIAPAYAFAGINDRLVRYRLHGSSFTSNPTGMQHAARAVIEKHFGPDDGQVQSWSWEKRRAYGGLYRYHVLTSVQRQNDWKVAESYMGKALQIDPTLSTDLDLFYDLAHGNQPQGYRGTSYQLDLQVNATHIANLLSGIFPDTVHSELSPLRTHTYSTAYFALGLHSFHYGQLQLCRRFLLAAIRFRPGLALNVQVLGTLSRSILGQSLLNWLRNFRRLIRNPKSL